MPRPNDVGVGTAALILRDCKVLLLKRQGSHAAGLWAVPGGWIDKTDCDLTLSLKREVEEEIGVNCRIDSPSPEAVTTEDHGEFRSVTLYYICFLDGEPQIIEPEKCSELKWFGWKEVEEMGEAAFFPGLYGILGDLHMEGDI